MVDKKRIVQIGVLTKDAAKSAVMWAEYLGKPVPAVKETFTFDVTGAVFRGRPCDGRIRQAAFDLDNIQIEFIQPIEDGSASFWKESLDYQGECIHHIAFEVEHMDQEVRICESQGMECVQRGNFKGGCYAYLDARAQLGIILEYLEHYKKDS